MLLAKEYAQHQWVLESKELEHAHKMDTRVWVTQFVGLILGFVNVIVLAVVAWHYADTGNLVPGLAVFSTGAGATASVYGIGWAIAKRQSRRRASTMEPLD
jgi:hypothetical protein